MCFTTTDGPVSVKNKVSLLSTEHVRVGLWICFTIKPVWFKRVLLGWGQQVVIWDKLQGFRKQKQEFYKSEKPWLQAN